MGETKKENVFKGIWWESISLHRLGAESRVSHNRYQQNWTLNYLSEVHLEVFRLSSFTRQSSDTQSGQSQGDQAHANYSTILLI